LNGLKKKSVFIQSDERVQKTVRDILTEHGKLLLGGKKANGAEPYVIALAKVHSYAVVT